MTFLNYYIDWVKTYKEGAVRKVTLDKYKMTTGWLEKIAPELKIKDINRIEYQKILNEYAETHEKQTTMDFHHQLKGAILDAVDEGLIERDPTRKIVIKGKQPREKKTKFLNKSDLEKLLNSLKLKNDKVTWDWFILLVAKTGLRFAEALALTRNDFNFDKQEININKTWNYKGDGGFAPTKNESSVRKVKMDWKLCIQMNELFKNTQEREGGLVFIDWSSKVYNSTVNGLLERKCRKLDIEEISIHGLRHTHASILLYNGVTVASVAKRLGHSNMVTTQKTYLHVIQELEDKDNNTIMGAMCAL